MPNTQALWHSEKSLTALLVKDKLADWRAQQLQAFLSSGFPARKDEDWKYTDVRDIANADFTFQSSKEIDEAKAISDKKLDSTYCVVFVNGVLSVELSDELSGLPFTVLPIVDALEQESVAATLLKSAADKMASGFSCLNDALFQQGVFIETHKKQSVDKPIHLLHIQMGAVSSLQPIRHVVSASESSQLTVIEEYVSDVEGAYFNNVMTQIHVKKNAHVSHYRLQNESKQAFHIGQVLISQEADSQVQTYHFNRGARLARHDLHYALLEKGASAKSVGLYCSDGEQHLDLHTRIDHLAAHCVSEQLYRGALKDKSHAVFNGKIIVHPDAQKTQADLNNKNLLLSKAAQVDTKPELEIYADDVRCSHGATVGCLDPNALFYLRARGIPIALANELLTRAFLTEVIEQVPNPAVYARLETGLANDFLSK